MVSSGRSKPNRQLVGEESSRNIRWGPECQMRQIAPPETATEGVREVSDLLAFGRQPRQVLARQHGIQQHDAFDRCSD